MSRSTIAQRKSSPCCIGCLVLLVIAIGLSLAAGIFMYRFAKNNIVIENMAAKADPPLDTAPEMLLPRVVGDFTRTSLHDTLENVPEWQDISTSGAHVAVYEDNEGHSMTVIAAPSQEAQAARETGVGILTMGRAPANSPDTGVTIKDSFSGPGTRMITVWAKENWTFLVQTSSTLTKKFLEDFNPGGAVTTGTTTAIEEAPPGAGADAGASASATPASITSALTGKPPAAGSTPPAGTPSQATLAGEATETTGTE